MSIIDGIIGQAGAKVLEGVVGGGLAAIGVPDRIAGIAARSVVLVAEWAAKAIEDGRDAEAELQAMLGAAEMVADEAEARKFGG